MLLSGARFAPTIWGKSGPHMHDVFWSSNLLYCLLLCNHCLLLTIRPTLKLIQVSFNTSINKTPWQISHKNRISFKSPPDGPWTFNRFKKNFFTGAVEDGWCVMVNVINECYF